MRRRVAFEMNAMGTCVRSTRPRPELTRRPEESKRFELPPAAADRKKARSTHRLHAFEPHDAPKRDELGNFGAAGHVPLDHARHAPESVEWVVDAFRAAGAMRESCNRLLA